MGQSLDHGPGPVWRLDVLWSVGMGQATKDQLNEGAEKLDGSNGDNQL